MAEVLLSDYFAEHNGAANDAADCTAAVNAALAAVQTVGGVLRLPSGVCRIGGKVFSNGFQPVTILGDGSSTFRFIGTADRRMDLNAQDHTLSVENVTFIGKNPTNVPRNEAFNATDMFLMVKAKVASFTNCRFLGLATESGRGLVVLNNSMGIFDKCQFDGSSSGSVGGCIAGNMLTSLVVKNCNFIDHVVYNGVDYSKTELGNRAWIGLTSWQPGNSSNYQRTVSIENTTFDEGVIDAVHIDGADSVFIKQCGVNKPFSGTGYNIRNTKDVRFVQSMNGYRVENDHLGLKLHNVDFARFERFRQVLGTNHIEITGNTKKVVFENCSLFDADRQHTVYKNGINNAANALLDIDGVKHKNGIIQY